MKYHIQDWAGNICFFGASFVMAEDAEEYLSEELGDDYDVDREEYYIEPIANGMK